MIGSATRVVGGYRAVWLLAAFFVLCLHPNYASAQGASLALTKSASPTSYTGAGQDITYTYTVTNDGSQTFFFSLKIRDDQLGNICDVPTPFDPGESFECTATYTTTQTDVDNGSIKNKATASGDPCGECGVTRSPPAKLTVPFRAQSSWTLNKTASPTTYSAAGETINYSYRLRNTGNARIFSIAITDDKVAPVTCPATTLAPSAAMTCSGGYSTTAADVSAGRVTNVATATGTVRVGTLPPVTARATIRAVAPGAGSITIIKTAVGGDGSFNFSTSGPGPTNFNLATTGGAARRTFANLNPARYTFTEVNLPRGWTLSGLTCSGDSGGRPTTVDLGGGTATVGLDGGEAITCTFRNSFKRRDDTPKKIENFLAHRLTLLEEGPDRTRIFRRIPNALWGDTGSGSSGISSEPVALSTSGEDEPMQMSVATSLLQISEAYAQAAGAGNQLPMPGLDVWLEAHFSEFDDDADSLDTDGHFGIAYLGADYLVTPSVLVGALVQVDWTDQDSTDGSSAEGVGAMAGPYVSARLGSNLFFSARAAYGSSENSIDPFGTYQDDFSTDRWLASAELTGNWNFGNWRVTPGAKVTYAEEDQQSYTDSRGVGIPKQTVALGELSFGPEIAYRYIADGGIVFEPQVSVTGLWDFDSPAGGAIGDLVTTDADLRAMVSAGFMAQLLGGASFRLVGTYDGIGAGGYQSFGGQGWLSIPLR